MNLDSGMLRLLGMFFAELCPGEEMRPRNLSQFTWTGDGSSGTTTRKPNSTKLPPPFISNPHTTLFLTLVMGIAALDSTVDRIISYPHLRRPL